MRLTKTDKESFVRAVMDDVPRIDYDEKAATIARKAIRESLPPIVAEAVTEHPECFDSIVVGLPYGILNIRVLATKSGGYDALKAMPEVWAELERLSKENKAQATARSVLQSKVSGAIEGCSTLKQALDRLPEFEKYLPKERNGTGVLDLPAVANVVSDLMAAGWPK